MSNKKRLSQMCYSEYVAHLKSKGIDFTEKSDIDIDWWMCCYVAVLPERPSMVTRYFREDGGDQLTLFDF